MSSFGKVLIGLMLVGVVEMQTAAEEKGTELPALKIAGPGDDAPSVTEAIETLAAEGARVVVFSGIPEAGTPEDGLDSVAAACQKHGLYAVVGIRRSENGAASNRARVFSPEGEVIHEHSENDLAIFDLDGVPCSLTVDEDIFYPELSRLPVLGGAKILFHLGTGKEPGPSVDCLLRARAIENEVFVVALAVQGSRILDPSGEDIAEKTTAGVFAVVDPNRAKGKRVVQGSEHPVLTPFWREGLRAFQTENQTYFKPVPEDHPTIRIASVSFVPTKWGKDENMEKCVRYIREAAKENVDLIVFPEGILEGYVVNEVDRAEPEKKPELEKRFIEIAEPIDGPYLKRVKDLAKEYSVMICFGFAERCGEDVYNSVALIGRNGEVLGKYSKTHLAQGYGHPPFYKTGTEFPSFETDKGRIGMIICYDRQLPEPARLVRLSGADFILAPSYGSTGEWNDQVIRMRARENGVPMLFCHPNQSLFVNAGGDVLANVVATDHIEVCEVPLPTQDTDRITLRRPDLYQGFLEDAPSGKKP
jgi:predicted amidohydrolase